MLIRASKSPQTTVASSMLAVMVGPQSVRRMMKESSPNRLRLTFGPVLIGLLCILVWLDGFVNQLQIPAELHWFREPDGTAIAGIPLVMAGLLVCGRAGYELSRIFVACNFAASRKSLTFCAAAGLLAGALTIGRNAPVQGTAAGAILATAAGASLFLTMLAFTRDKDIKGASGAVGAAMIAFVYAGLMLGFLVAIRREHGLWVLLTCIMTIKSCDIGAYFTGRALGRHKLIPWLSPGKTWEGLAGGLVCSSLGGIVLLLLMPTFGPGQLPGLNWWTAAIFGAVLGLAGQLGDLSASVFKRDAGIKDAGAILPGFGGVVDMLDSLFLAAPVAFWGLWFLVR